MVIITTQMNSASNMPEGKRASTRKLRMKNITHNAGVRNFLFDRAKIRAVSMVLGG
jgi:hypothetical protein